MHVNNNHSLSARRLQNTSNLNVNPANGGVDSQSQNQFYSVSEKRFKRGETRLKANATCNESQRSRVHRIKRMFFTEQLKFKTDNALPGVFHGKSGGKLFQPLSLFPGVSVRTLSPLKFQVLACEIEKKCAEWVRKYQGWQVLVFLTEAWCRMNSRILCICPPICPRVRRAQLLFESGPVGPTV